MKTFNRIMALTVALALAGGLSSCLKYEKKANSHTSGTTTMVCDNSFENIMKQVHKLLDK